MRTYQATRACASSSDAANSCDGLPAPTGSPQTAKNLVAALGFVGFGGFVVPHNRGIAAASTRSIAGVELVGDAAGEYIAPALVARELGHQYPEQPWTWRFPAPAH